MKERPFDFFDESFSSLSRMQEDLEKQGLFVLPVPKEHIEAKVTRPLIQKIRTRIKKRGFDNVAGNVFITFSGFAHDTREVYQIPEVRGFVQQLDRDLPELPALLGISQDLLYNGPGLYVSCLGNPDEQTIPDDPHYFQRYNLYVDDAKTIVSGAVHRIHVAGRKYGLSRDKTERMVERFMAGVVKQ